jgi:hypothetical protein
VNKIPSNTTCALLNSINAIVSASQGHHQVNIKLLKVKDINIGGACHTGSHVVYSDNILSGFRLKKYNIWGLISGDNGYDLSNYYCVL